MESFAIGPEMASMAPIVFMIKQPWISVQLKLRSTLQENTSTALTHDVFTQLCPGVLELLEISLENITSDVSSDLIETWSLLKIQELYVNAKAQPSGMPKCWQNTQPNSSPKHC